MSNFTIWVIGLIIGYPLIGLVCAACASEDKSRSPRRLIAIFFFWPAWLVWLLLMLVKHLAYTFYCYAFCNQTVRERRSMKTHKENANKHYKSLTRMKDELGEDFVEYWQDAKRRARRK